MNSMKPKVIILVAALLTAICMATYGQNQKYEQYKLKNGLQVTLIEYGSIDATGISLFVNAGIKNEIPGRQGIAELTAQAVLFGSNKYDRLKQTDLLYTMGTDISSYSNDNFTKISAIFLNRDLETGFDIFAAAVRQPVFPDADVRQSISEYGQFNKSSKMDINVLAERFSKLFVYGASNPLGRNPYPAQMEKIKTTEIKEFYDFNYTPKNSRIVICGKLDKEKVKKLVETYFSDWQAAYGENNQVSLEPPIFNNREYGFVNRDSATQAYLCWIKKAPEANDKDALPFQVATQVFNKILFDEIREKGGKTYNISMGYDDVSLGRIYSIETQTRCEESFNTVTDVDNVLNNFCTKGITAGEFALAKLSMKNEFKSANSPTGISGFYNPLVYTDIGKRANYLAGLEALPLETVNKIIKKYFNPDSYKLMIAGSESGLRESLDKFKNLKRFPNNAIEVDQ